MLVCARLRHVAGTQWGGEKVHEHEAHWGRNRSWLMAENRAHVKGFASGFAALDALSACCWVIKGRFPCPVRDWGSARLVNDLRIILDGTSRFPMCAAEWRIQHMGNTWESRRKARGRKLCASVTSVSLVVFDECATLYLVRIFSAARCDSGRKNFLLTTANYVKTYVKISPFHFIEKSPPDVARICEDRLNVFRLGDSPVRTLAEAERGGEGNGIPRYNQILIDNVLRSFYDK